MSPDLQAIDLVRFHPFGDAGGAALTGSMLVNALVPCCVAEPGGLPLWRHSPWPCWVWRASVARGAARGARC